MTAAADLTLDELRLELAPRIAAAAIFDGWSDVALISASEAAGADPAVARLAFPGGAIDMIAANISSSRFVEGAPTKPDAIDLDALTVSMTRDGAPVTHGAGKDSLGDQWESLRTLINIIVANRGQIDKGWIILTGKIGDKGTATPGHYIAGYGPLGEIQFQIQACPER